MRRVINERNFLKQFEVGKSYLYFVSARIRAFRTEAKTKPKCVSCSRMSNDDTSRALTCFERIDFTRVMDLGISRHGLGLFSAYNRGQQRNWLSETHKFGKANITDTKFKRHSWWVNDARVLREIYRSGTKKEEEGGTSPLNLRIGGHRICRENRKSGYQ